MSAGNLPVNATGLISRGRVGQSFAGGASTFKSLKVIDEFVGGANAAVVATTSGATAVPASLTPFVLVFDTATTKILPLLSGYDSTTGLFTAPRDGVYSISYSTGWSSPGPGSVASPIKVFLFIDNWPFHADCIIPLDTGFFVASSGTVVAVMGAGETARVEFVNASGAGISLNAGAAIGIVQLTAL